MRVRRLTGAVLLSRFSVDRQNNGFKQPLDSDIVHVKECPLWDFVLVEVATEPHDERVEEIWSRRPHDEYTMKDNNLS